MKEISIKETIYLLKNEVITENAIHTKGTKVSLIKLSEPFCVVKGNGWYFTTRVDNLEIVKN